MYAKLTVIGRLGKDPELRTTQSQKAVCNFSIAVSDRGPDGKETTEWYNVVAWEKTGQNCAQYLKKGSLVYVEGRPSLRSFTDKQGVARTSLEVNAGVVKFLSPKSETAPGPNHGISQKPADTPIVGWDDNSLMDIPF